MFLCRKVPPPLNTDKLMEGFQVEFTPSTIFSVGQEVCLSPRWRERKRERERERERETDRQKERDRERERDEEEDDRRSSDPLDYVFFCCSVLSW